MSQPHTTKSLGKGMLAAGWVVLLVLLAIFFTDMEESKNNPNKIPSGTSTDGTHQVTLKRNRHHHYVANGSINKHNVTFLIDTGATTVSLSPKLANKLGLKPGLQGYAQTANGLTETRTTVIDELKLGTITLYNVPASITMGMYDEEVLLGMSALKSIEFTHKEGVLTLTQYR